MLIAIRIIDHRQGKLPHLLRDFFETRLGSERRTWPAEQKPCGTKCGAAQKEPPFNGPFAFTFWVCRQFGSGEQIAQAFNPINHGQLPSSVARQFESVCH